MNTEKKNFSPRPNVRKFVDWDVKDFNPEWPIVRLMDALENNRILVEAGYLAECLPTPDCTGIIHMMGWEFDFRPYLSRFVAKVMQFDNEGNLFNTSIREYIGISEKAVREWIENAKGVPEATSAEIVWLIEEPSDERFAA